MVLFGFTMAAIGLLYLFFSWRRSKLLEKKWWLILVGLMTPLGFLCIETGWIVTELGRQPWIIYRIMRTEEALTPMPGIIYPFMLITLIYLLLSFLSVFLMQRQIRYINENADQNL
jgi:cytochrome bd ubiquinol oxidase subunit I